MSTYSRCKKLIEEEESKRHIPTISHYRDNKNPMNTTRKTNTISKNPRSVYLYKGRIVSESDAKSFINYINSKIKTNMFYVNTGKYGDMFSSQDGEKLA